MQLIFTHKRYFSITDAHITSTLSMLEVSYKKRGQMFSHIKLTLHATPGKNLTAFLNPPSAPLLQHYHNYHDIAWIRKEDDQGKKEGNTIEKHRAL